MFKGLGSSSSSNNPRKLQSQLEGLVFSRELLSNPDVTFNIAPYPNGSILGYDGEIACMSFDAVQSLLAIATKSGRITVYADFARLPRLSFTIKPGHAINHLLLKSGTSILLAIDAKETLHVFDLADLDERGEPKRLLSHSMRSRVNSIESTPTLSHIFIACQDGSIDTFDVERCSQSPFRIKNLWMEQDELLRRSGVPNAPSRKRIPACVEAKLHPLDPTQLLIAYEGGIALYSITDHHTIRTYEYIVLPGAPGGHDDQTEGAFLERRPMCTSLSWRPDGRMFAAGYDDGSFALWGIEDGDKPVMARTISMEDVNLATSSSLFGPDAHEPNAVPGSFREPIYKLAWCGFSDTQSHKGTILVVLGGLMPSDIKGLHCLHFPAFSAPSILYSSDPKQVLQAYRISVKPNYTSVLPTDSSPEEFVLITHNPYYSQTYDPFQVVIMLSKDPDLPQVAPHTQRGFVAYPFPASMGTDPKQLPMPIDLHLTGSQAVVWAEAATLSAASYKRIQGDNPSVDRLLLTGGEAISSSLLAPGKTRVHDKHHAVLTVSLDMTVRVWDYTKALPRLLHTFSARDGLSDDQLLQYIEGRMLVGKVSAAWDTTEIAFGLSTGDVLLYKYQYARPDAVNRREEQDDSEHYRSRPASSTGAFRQTSSSYSPHLDSGLSHATAHMNLRDTPSPSHQSHHRSNSTEPSKSRKLFGGRKGHAKDAGSASSSSNQMTSFEITLDDVSHLSDWSKDSYKPVFSLSAAGDGQSGHTAPITALSLSEAGFLAVAWGTKLAILDLRGPEILFNEADGTRDGNIILLTWTICAEGSDLERHPRLLVNYESGLIKIYTLSYTLDTWIVNTNSTSLRHDSCRQAISHFLLDPHANTLDLDGASLDSCLRADQQAAMGHTPAHQSGTAAGALHTISIVVTPSMLAVFGNLTSERLVKRDFGQSRAVAASIISKYAMPVLAIVMDDGQCAILSLPNCGVVRTMQIPYERSWPSISPDGRIFQVLSPSFFNYCTIFPDQLPPRIKCKYHLPDKVLPAAPGSSMVSSASAAAATYISSWFSTETAKKWEPVNLDDIMGGPNRPPPRVKKQAVQQAPIAVQPATSSASTLRAGPPERPQRATRDRVKEVEVEYNAFGIPKKRHELTDALEERGDRLDFLNQHLDNASQASQDFLSQAKRTAMISSAKGAVTGVGKGAMFGISKMLS